MPIWYAKQICPATEYLLWRKRFELKWKEKSLLSYEHAYTRQTIVSAFTGKAKPIEDYMLSFEEEKTPFNMLSDDEKAEIVAAAKARRRQLG